MSGGDGADRALAVLRCAVDALAEIDVDAMTTTELDEFVVAHQRETQRLAAVVSPSLARWEALAVWASDGSKSAKARLGRAVNCTQATAGRALRRARSLRAMPAVAAAILESRLSMDHVDLFADAAAGREAVFAEETALAGAPAALAQPGGDNGDVKIHEVGTPFDDQRNEPKVCDFYLAAFNFDPEERVTWTIRTQPEVSGGAQLPNATHPDNTVTIEQDGTAQTIPLALPDGQYKLNISGLATAGYVRGMEYRLGLAAPGPQFHVVQAHKDVSGIDDLSGLQVDLNNACQESGPDGGFMNGPDRPSGRLDPW